MKTQSIIAAIAALSTSTLAAPAAPASPTSAFLIQAIKPGSKFHLSHVNANNNTFWLNKPTTSFCGTTVETCPSGKDTVFTSGNGRLFLDVDVPGGQDVYVSLDSATTGLIGFSSAHANSLPPTSTYAGFTFDTEGNLVYRYEQLLACEDSLNPGVYLIYAEAGEPINPGCVSFTATPVPTKGAGAWQYE